MFILYNTHEHYLVLIVLKLDQVYLFTSD
jgi:hypothetical protein